MDDRFKYAEVRQKIIDAIRTDLIGPLSPEEVLDENPRFAYLVGMLEPQRISTMARTRTSPQVRMMTTSPFLPQSSSFRHPSASVFMWKAVSTASASM